jgi:uncharacterized protein
MVCIYHSRDLDGYTSGAIVKRKYPDAKMIGYDYGQPLTMEITGEPVIMVDVSMPMVTMAKIASMSNFQFTWIDHHASAIKDYKEFIGEGESFCTAILEDGISACEGTWKYLFPDEPMPEGIKLLGEYDTWRNQDKERWENRILPYQFGMRIHCSSPETFPWDSLADVDKIIRDGNIVLAYQREQNAKACKSAFPIDFENFHAICLNGGGFNSDVFKSVYDESKHDIMMPFMFNGKFWTISLYTTKDDIDCSVIAKRYGGGGHKKAAGFQVEDIRSVIPFA